MLQPFRAELDGNIDTFARAALADGRLSDAHAEEPFERRLHALALELDDPAPLLDLGRGKQRTPGMFRIYCCPSLLDIVESVIGPEILAHPQFNVRAKRPYQDEGVVPWHQDLGYLQPDAEETFMVNLWIPLVDATRENGCMEVIAGSHRGAADRPTSAGWDRPAISRASSTSSSPTASTSSARCASAACC